MCDGAGSAAYGGQGASLVCRTFANALRAHFRQTVELPDAAFFTNLLDNTRDRIFALASRRSLVPRDFASTMICAVCNGSNLVVAQVGDGCAVARDHVAGTWVAPIWPDHGEYASTTRFVTDDSAPALRVEPHIGPVDAIVMFTDGLERLGLDFKTNAPHSPFCSGVARPLLDSSMNGWNRVLSQQLAEYLNGPAVNARTDDDKTLVIAVLK